MKGIRYEYIRGTEQRGFGDKFREARLRWFVHVREIVNILLEGCQADRQEA